MRIVIATLAAVLVLVAGIEARAPQAAKPAAPTAKPAPQAAKAAKLAWPAAVEAAFKKSYPNATVKAVSKEVEGGKTIFEVESIDNGRRRDINYNPDGTVILYEEELKESEVPPAVMAAIKKRYPKATATTFERLFVTKDNSANYEIILKGAPVKDVVLTPDGTWVSPKAGK
jgi:hypothetical protein